MPAPHWAVPCRVCGLLGGPQVPSPGGLATHGASGTCDSLRGRAGPPEADGSQELEPGNSAGWISFLPALPRGASSLLPATPLSRGREQPLLSGCISAPRRRAWEGRGARPRALTPSHSASAGTQGPHAGHATLGQRQAVGSGVKGVPWHHPPQCQAPLSGSTQPELLPIVCSAKTANPGGGAAASGPIRPARRSSVCRRD